MKETRTPSFYSAADESMKATNIGPDLYGGAHVAIYRIAFQAGQEHMLNKILNTEEDQFLNDKGDVQ